MPGGFRMRGLRFPGFLRIVDSLVFSGTGFGFFHGSGLVFQDSGFLVFNGSGYWSGVQELLDWVFQGLDFYRSITW